MGWQFGINSRTHFWIFWENCPCKARTIWKFSKIKRVIYPKNYLNHQQTLCIETNPDIFIIRNPNIFIIRGIFKTLKYSKVQRYLHFCQTFHNVFRKSFQAITNLIFAECSLQKEPFASVFKIGVLKNFPIFTGKHLRWISAYSYSSAYSCTFRTLFIPDIFRILAYSYYKAYSESIVYS